MLAGLRDREWLIGAGTVLSSEDVRRTREAGGGIIISPNCNAEVIRTSLELGLEVMPGIATATEAFAAIRESKADEETELWLRRLRDEAFVEIKM